MVLYYFLRWFVIICLGLFIYGQTLHYDFVFDDYIFIVTNPFIKNLSNFHLIWHSFPMTRFIGMYSFALNYHFGQLQARGYHMFNFAVHLVCTGLVWALAGMLNNRGQRPVMNGWKKDSPLPFFIALLFLVHPCQTQAVTYITQRFESMATLFYLAAVFFYLKARLSTARAWAVILFTMAALSTLFGMMTKETVTTLPLTILALEWVFFDLKYHKSLGAMLVAIGLMLGMFLAHMLHADFRVFLSTFGSESHDGDVFNGLQYVLTQMRVFLTFMRLFILPIHQNLDYDFIASKGLLDPPLTLAGLAVIAGIITLIFKWRAKFPLLSFGMAWVLITFSINLAPRSNVIFEHKLYLISFGFFLSLVAALNVLLRAERGNVLIIKILSCIIAVLALASYERNKVWANELLLWQDSLKNSPHKERVNANLGRAYGNLGRYDECIEYLSRAIAIRADNITYENRGVIYAQKGQYARALDDLNHSIAMDPGYFPVFLKRAWVYQLMHQYDAALADIARALQGNAYYTDAFIARGLLLVQMGRPEDARQDFIRAQALEPQNPQIAQYLSSLP